MILVSVHKSVQYQAVNQASAKASGSGWDGLSISERIERTQREMDTILSPGIQLFGPMYGFRSESDFVLCKLSQVDPTALTVIPDSYEVDNTIVENASFYTAEAHTLMRLVHRARNRMAELEANAV